MRTIKLEKLIGKHLLSGVDTYAKKITDKNDYNFGVDANCISFILDGITYTAVEDVDDGYRSSMKKLGVDTVVVKNTFPKTEVLVRMKSDSDYQVNDILEFINTKNGKIVLEVGTDGTDYYYPCFVANFYPELLK